MSATSNTFDDPDERSEHLRASPPLLPWPMLDRFTRVHPAVPALLYLPVVAILVGYALDSMGVGTLLVWAAVGYGLWTLTEYWLHRIVFHFEPEDGLGAKLHWLIHGVHHEHPNDPNRLVMPPSASIPLAAIFLVLYRVVFGAPAWLAVSAGFLVGYVVYDTMHWYLHHRIPRSRLGRRLRELHLRHHFQDDTRGFGISAPYWDRVFRTAPVSRREAGARASAAARADGPAARQPQTDFAVSTIRRSLSHCCSSRERRCPRTVEEKPHCGERQSWSTSTYRPASSMRRSRSSRVSSSPRLVVTRPRTTYLPLGTKRSGSKPPERASSHSMKKPSTSSWLKSASATKS